MQCIIDKRINQEWPPNGNYPLKLDKQWTKLKGYILQQQLHPHIKCKQVGFELKHFAISKVNLIVAQSSIVIICRIIAMAQLGSYCNSVQSWFRFVDPCLDLLKQVTCGVMWNVSIAGLLWDLSKAIIINCRIVFVVQWRTRCVLNWPALSLVLVSHGQCTCCWPDCTLEGEEYRDRRDNNDINSNSWAI